MDFELTEAQQALADAVTKLCSPFDSAYYNGEMSHDELSFSERSKTHIYAINENGQTYSPRWYTLSLMTNYEFNKNILLRIGIENMLDAQYRPYSSGIVAPGRGVFIGLRGSI